MGDITSADVVRYASLIWRLYNSNPVKIEALRFAQGCACSRT